MSDGAYNYAYLDEQTKRMIRRAILKAVAVPGYQVPFGGREMPLPYGWGTGGIQVTAAIIGRDDTLKVIDQGADDTTNAVSIRRFFAKVAQVATTTRTEDATVIQTRHRVPETPLGEGQILVFQVPIPEPLRMLEPRETETRTLHALSEYGVMQVSLYESIARHGRIAKTYNYPVMVNGRYIMSPSPIPKFDNPKLDRSPALQLYGAGREKRIYAVPPHTGRGGWTWYTGSAGWMYRAGLESILGFKLHGERLQIDPCVPRWWRDFEITYRRARATYRIKVENPHGFSHGVATVELDGAMQHDGEIPLTDDGQTHEVRVVLGEKVVTDEPAAPENEIDKESASR